MHWLIICCLAYAAVAFIIFWIVVTVGKRADSENILGLYDEN